MVLLNLSFLAAAAEIRSIFTFHYGSIKSGLTPAAIKGPTNFTFQYGSIKSYEKTDARINGASLHSSMVLLNHIFFYIVYG